MSKEIFYGCNLKIIVKEGETDDNDEIMQQGFVELYNDGEMSSLRIFYLENNEPTLQRDCIQIAELKRSESSDSLTFRICKLKSGLKCNDHVLMKPERPKDCHTIYYTFRFLQQKTTAITTRSTRQQSTARKRTLVKQVPAFRQISATRRAYTFRKANKERRAETVISPAKNGRLKRKAIASSVVTYCSPSKKQSLNGVKRTKSKCSSKKISKLKKKSVSSDETLLRSQSHQSSSDLSADFERLSAGEDTASPKGLLNLGSSCYMNAVIQGLFHVQAFKDLLNGMPGSSIHTEGTVLNGFKSILHQYRWAAVEKKRGLLENIFIFLNDKRFAMNRQEDAQEFLTIVLDKIDRELSSFAHSIVDMVPVTSLSSIFGFELKHEITCKKCGNKQEKLEDGMFVPVQFVNEINTESSSLQMLLDNCFKNEEVEHTCPQCGDQHASMSHAFWSLSNCLIIFLKRYEYEKLATRRRAKKRQDVVNLSLCIRLIKSSREQHREVTERCDSVRPTANSGSSGDAGSIVLETPPEDFGSTGPRTGSTSQICGDGKLSLGKFAKASSFAYDSNANKRLTHSTLFCPPRPEFCERACAALNICYKSSPVRQEPKPIFHRSVPSKVVSIAADGNCLFRSVAFCIAGSDEQHLNVRRSVVYFEKKYGSRLRQVKNVSPAGWKKHINKMENDGEWATEIELLALAALLDVEIWTFLEGRWLRYRPLFRVGTGGTIRELPIKEYEDNKKDTIFLANDGVHFRPVLDISSDETIHFYQLAAVISHKGNDLNSGHYLCDVRNRKGNFWTRYNDNVVQKTPEATVLPDCAKNGYIFFYVAGVVFYY